MVNLRKIKFYIDSMLGSGSNSLIVWLGAVSFVFVLAASFLTWIVGISDHESFGDLLWDFTMRAITPWEIEASMGSLPYLFVMLIVTLFGIFVLSILISFLSAIIDARVQAVGKGLQPFPFSGHIIIFGWSSRVPAIIEELVLANESESESRIVIASNLDHEQLEALIKQNVRPTKNTSLFWRSRKLNSAGTFENLNVLGARSIVILGDKLGPTLELDRLKTTIALFNYLDRTNTKAVRDVIVEAGDFSEAESLRLGSKNRAIPVVVSDLPARLIVETVFQPNLPSVYEQLLSFEGNEIYITESVAHLDVMGMRFGGLQTATQTSIPIGVITADGEILINPDSERRVQQDERLMVIAQDDSLINFNRDSYPDEISSQHGISVSLGAGDLNSRRLDVLILGNSESTDEIVLGLLASARCRITVLVSETSQIHPVVLDCANDSKIQLVYGEIGDTSVSGQIDLAHADALIVSNFDRDEPDNSDLKILRTLLGIHDKSKQNGGPHVIAELNASDSRDMMADLFDLDFVVSDKIGSKVFAQYIENPHLIKVIDALICSNQHRITIRDMHVSGAAEVTFRNIQSMIVDSKGVLIGIRYKASEVYQTILNPGPDYVVRAAEAELQGIFVE